MFCIHTSTKTQKFRLHWKHIFNHYLWHLRKNIPLGPSNRRWTHSRYFKSKWMFSLYFWPPRSRARCFPFSRERVMPSKVVYGKKWGRGEWLTYFSRHMNHREKNNAINWLLSQQFPTIVLVGTWGRFLKPHLWKLHSKMLNELQASLWSGFAYDNQLGICVVVF